MTPTFVSLFCGCGGFDVGFVDAGFRCIGAYDINPTVVEVHRRNIAGPVRVCDLAEGFPLEARTHPSVVLAGPPCQGFSTAGKRLINDPRNTLLLTAVRLATRLQPQVIIIENVSGVVAGAHRKFWQEVINHLRLQNYRATEIKCDATKMHVPQIRTRMMIFAWTTTYDRAIDFRKIQGGTLRDAIAQIDGVPNHDPILLNPHSKAGKIARRIGPNQKLSDVRSSDRSIHTWEIPEVFGRTNKQERILLEALLRRRRQKRPRSFGDADPVTAHALRSYLGRPVVPTLRNLIAKGYVRRVGSSYDLARTFNGKFRRLCWDLPSLTVDTKFGDPHYFLHPKEDRTFTVREAARIQTFPDTFVFYGSKSSQMQMLGNAVPPAMVQIIGHFCPETNP